MLIIPILFRSVVTLLKRNSHEQSSERAAVLVTEQVNGRTIFRFGSKDIFMTVSKDVEKTVSTFVIGIEPSFQDAKIIKMLLLGMIRGAGGGRLIQIGVEKCKRNDALEEALHELKFSFAKEFTIQEGQLTGTYVIYYKAPEYDLDDPPLHIKLKTTWTKFLKKVFPF